MQRFIFIPRKQVVHFALRVRTGMKAGNCYEECNNDLGVCMSGPADNDPFALSIDCQANYDQCVNECMST